MTNQETIANLNMISVAFVEPVTKEQRKLIDDTFDNSIKALEQEPCEDAISRQAVLDLIEHYNSDGLGSVFYGYEEGVKFSDAVNKLSSVTQEPKTGQFAEWVATEIFDANWEYNKDAFAELACRKLEKLGIVRANGDEWELVEQEEERDKE